MRIKVFIVTYNSNDLLNENLESLYKSDLLDYEYKVFIINNHSNLRIDNEYPNLKVLENGTRPDYSTGHLTRDWNAALINGFKDLNAPDADIVVCTQNDIEVQKDWAKKIIEGHKKYSFIVTGQGDAFHSYTPEAVKKVGLWDEAFCGIGYHDRDYFLRVMLCNPDGSSFSLCHNDGTRHFEYNRIVGPRDILKIKPNGSARQESYYQDSCKWHGHCKRYFYKKWSRSVHPNTYLTINGRVNGLGNRLDPRTEPSFEQPVLYPYFENLYFPGGINPALKNKKKVLRK